MDLKPDFEFTSVSGRIVANSAATLINPGLLSTLLAPNPLGPLAELAGKWAGTGFNQIWRPNHGSVDHFLELNETIEQIEFDPIPGDIPNRGFLQGDMNIHGIRYLQQLQDANVKGPNGQPAGLHLEPGIWVSVPVTTGPQDPATIARMASIPHGTTILAQGTGVTTSGPPNFAAESFPITPFNAGGLIPFPQDTTLATASANRTPHTDIPHVIQAMLDNPISVLVSGLAGKHVTSTTKLTVSTKDLNPPSSGGGTSNIAFLQGAAAGPNAQTTEMKSTFWIETIQGSSKRQLQYAQRVILLFAGLSWPHVTVGTLTEQ